MPVLFLCHFVVPVFILSNWAKLLIFPYLCRFVPLCRFCKVVPEILKIKKRRKQKRRTIKKIKNIVLYIFSLSVASTKLSI